MKKTGLILFTLLFFSLMIFAQEKEFKISEKLNQIKEGAFKGILLNNELVQYFLREYLEEATNRGLSLRSHIERLNFIIVEPESNNPSELNEFNLGEVDRNKKMILLSRSCLIDKYILKATLFRELSHYLGVPYSSKGVGIMSLNKPEGYSYAWLSCDEANDIRVFEYDWLFKELRKVVN